MTMLEAHILTKNLQKEADYTIELGFDDRQKSRHRSTTQCGKDIGWFIERGHVLQAGDILTCETGETIKVAAANEVVSTVYPSPDSSQPQHDLTRAAYHLGNRHVPLQIDQTFLRYQHDHVLDEMVTGLGLRVEAESAPFNPESGAYSGGHSHNRHSHSHSQDSHSSSSHSQKSHNHTHAGHDH